MVKDTTLQGSTTDFNNDQDHGCCGVLKNPFRKRNAAARPSIPPETIARPAAPPANQHKHVGPQVDLNPGVQEGPEVITIPEDNPVPKDEEPSQTSKEEKSNAKFRNTKEQDEHVEPDVHPTSEIQVPKAITTPEDSPVPKDEDPSQTSREEKANARFRNAKEQLEKVISKPNAVSPIELSFLKSNEIGNVSQMARDIELAISEFLNERDKQNESQKGKETAMKWIQKVSFAGQKFLGTAESVASVGSMVNVAESRNFSHRRLAVWFLVLLDTF